MRHHLHERPETFSLNPNSELGQGLRIAVLGYQHDGGVAIDSCGNNHGVPTLGLPATYATWVPSLGRFGSKFASAVGGYLTFTDISLGSSWSIAAWVSGYGSGSYAGVVTANGGNGIVVETNHPGTIIGNADKFTSATLGSGDNHLVAISDNGTHALYWNGASIALPSSDTGWGLAGTKAGVGYGAEILNGIISDILIYPDRILSAGEIGVLSDPSDPMLGGLILPPRRRSFAAIAGEAPPATGNRRRRVLICGRAA